MITPLISVPRCLTVLKGSYTTADGFLQDLGENARFLDLHPDTGTHMGFVRSDVSEKVRFRHAQAIQRKAAQLASDFEEIYGERPLEPTALIEKRWDLPLQRPPNPMTRLVLGAADPDFSFADYCLPLGGILFFNLGEILEMIWEPRLRNGRANTFLPASFDLLQPDGAMFQRLPLPVNEVEAREFIAWMLEAHATPDDELTRMGGVGFSYETAHEGGCEAGFYPETGRFYSGYNISDFRGDGLKLSAIYKSLYGPGRLEPSLHKSCEVFVNPDPKQSWARGSLWLANQALGSVRPDSDLRTDVPQYIYYPGHVIEVRGYPGNIDKMLAMVNSLIRTLVPLTVQSLKSGVVSSPLIGTTGSVNREKAEVRFFINPPGLSRAEARVTLKPGEHGLIWQVELGLPNLSSPPASIIVRAYHVQNESTGDELWHYAEGEMKTAAHASLAAHSTRGGGPVH